MLQSSNFTITFHKYSIYINTHRNTQYKPICALQKPPVSNSILYHKIIIVTVNDDRQVSSLKYERMTLVPGRAYIV